MKVNPVCLGTKARWTIRVVSALGLFVALVAFGLWVRAMMPVPFGTARDTEVYSFDYLGHAHLLSNYHFIGYGRFRHPLFSWFMLPVTAFGQSAIQNFGEKGFWIYLCCIFSLFVLGSILLMRLLLQKGVGLKPHEAFLGTALFASFAHVWLLAGVPETYALSMLLGVLLLNCVTFKIADRQVDRLVWGTVLGAMGGVTLTQGIKGVLAYVVTKRPKVRQICIGAAAVAGILLLVALIFYVRLRIRTYFNPYGRGFDGAWHELFDPLTGWTMGCGEWLHRATVFFSEPIIVRGEAFDQRTIEGGYCSCIQPILLWMLYALAGLGAWLGRRETLVMTICAMLTVDGAIHLVAGWGLSEAQLYGAHWFFSLPVLVGFAVKGLSGRIRQAVAVLVAALAIGIFASNVHGYFDHDVGLIWQEVSE